MIFRQALQLSRLTKRNSRVHDTAQRSILDERLRGHRYQSFAISAKTRRTPNRHTAAHTVSKGDEGDDTQPLADRLEAIQCLIANKVGGKHRRVGVRFPKTQPVISNHAATSGLGQLLGKRSPELHATQ